jgi:hypothetical protein
MRNPLLALITALVTFGCGVAVTPTEGDGAMDAPAPDAVALDAVASERRNSSDGGSCVPLAPCQYDDSGSCSAGRERCSTCVPFVAVSGGARVIGAVCVGAPANRQSAGYRGLIGDEPTYVSLVNDHPERGGGECIRTEDCVAMYNAFIDRAQPGELVPRCRFADGTIAEARQPTFTQHCDDTLGLCAPRCACGEGRVCAFASQTVPSGVCVPRTSSDLRVSRPCRRSPDRIVCPSGEACLLPQRDNINIPDRERWGVCMPAQRCQAVHRYFQRTDSLFVCDESLTELDGGP